MERIDRVFAHEGTFSGHQLEEDRAEREQIRPRVDRIALDLLGRQIASRAENHPGERRDATGQRGVLRELRDAEIQDLRGARPGEEDVFGLEIAMDQPRACAATRPLARADAMRRVSAWETGPLPIGTRRVSPSSSSETRYGRPFAIPTSNTLTMLGWSSDAVILASCRNRSTACPSPRSAWVSTLSATSRPSRGSVARYTSPIPPRASSATTR